MKYLIRLREAADTLKEYSVIDGAHHKQWAILRVLELLLGPKEYEAFLEKYKPESGIPD